jgi:phosphoribosylanthranilate isomerase
MYGPAAEAVRRWVDEGATYFHLVDLAAAFGEPATLPGLLHKVRGDFPDVVFQVAGGIRDKAAAARLMGCGADRIVVGSALFLDPDGAASIVGRWGAARCIAALDVLDGVVRVKGWTEGTDEPIAEACARAGRFGFGEALVTDIARDGLLAGPNLGLYENLARSGLSIIASGGVAERAHLESLAAIPGVSGAVVGKALYEGRLTVKVLVGFGP